MALLDAAADLLVAAPGTVSTALREALLDRPTVTDIPADDGCTSCATPTRGCTRHTDVVLRMELLESDLRELVGLEVTVHVTNVTDRERLYWRAYDVASRELVEAAHADDLSKFGYAF